MQCCPFASLDSASSPPAGGLSLAVFRAAFASAQSVPPPRRSAGVNRPGFVPRRFGSRLCCSQIQTKCKKKQPPHPKRRAAVAAEAHSKWCFSFERPVAVSVKKIIAVAPAALGFHPGSSVFRRQPARLRSSPIRITPLSFANQTKCKKKQPPHPKRRAAVAAVAAPPTVSPFSPPSHQR